MIEFSNHSSSPSLTRTPKVRSMTSFRCFLIASTPLWLLAGPALAQQVPDAGQILRDIAPPAIEAPRPGAALDLQAPGIMRATPGGAEVTVNAIRFAGNTVYSDAELSTLVEESIGQSFDLAGLEGLAERISNHYRQTGYPFASALLAEQRLDDGTLIITLVEGRYGAVMTAGDHESFNAGAQKFLSQLEPGALIASDPLERATLILDDQPGVRIAPVIRPGQELGTGDLVVNVERDRRVTGDVGLDNHGGRYTGYHRARANLQINSPFMVGDQVALRTLASDRELYLGALSYNAPLGGSGLRGQVGVAHTSYSLAREFEALKATGTATVYSAGLTYPLIRTQMTNLTLGGTGQYKALTDKVGATDTSNRKSSRSLPATLQFDHRDSLGGGGITFGALSWTPGQLHLNPSLRAGDSTTARTHGTFHKANLDIARLQVLPAGFSVYGQFSAQRANKNLDSSEGFSLGGPQGVRAYPASEASGDEGVLAQAELRYNVDTGLDSLAPYVFFDAGGVRVNADPWAAGTNHRSLSGAGLGLRAAHNGITFTSSVAWRTSSDRPQSDTEDRRPTIWLSLGYTF